MKSFIPDSVEVSYFVLENGGRVSSVREKAMYGHVHLEELSLAVPERREFSL